MSNKSGTIDVFVENPKGAIVKIRHDELALVPTKCTLVPAPYPYAYGFIVGLPADDGDMLDCFVLSERTLYTGDRVDCVPIGYLEQWEDDEADFNILAVPVGETHLIDGFDIDEIHDTLRVFLTTIFSVYPDHAMRVGELRRAQDAYALIDQLTPN